jgi:hypothetical protein
MASEWNERIDRLREKINKHKNEHKEDKDIKK